MSQFDCCCLFLFFCFFGGWFGGGVFCVFVVVFVLYFHFSVNPNFKLLTWWRRGCARQDRSDLICEVSQFDCLEG